MGEQPKGLMLRSQYADSRDLSRGYVSKLCQSGIIELIDGKYLDPVVADRQREENIDSSRSPASRRREPRRLEMGPVLSTEIEYGRDGKTHTQIPISINLKLDLCQLQRALFAHLVGLLDEMDAEE